MKEELPGGMHMSDFVEEEAAKHGVSKMTISRWLRSGLYTGKVILFRGNGGKGVGKGVRTERVVRLGEITPKVPRGTKL